MDGWLKLHRSITESAVFEDAEVLKVWIWLLCNVAFDEHDTVYYGKVIHLHAGQIATGRKKISDSTNLSESKVYRALKILQELGNITIKVNSRFSLVTVANWAKFQDDAEKVNSSTTAQQQQNNSSATDEQQLGNGSATQQKNGKKEKNGKNIYICSFFEKAWEQYPKKKGKDDVTKKAMQELEAAGEETILRAIENYKAEIAQNKTEDKFIMYGSTFFNGRWKEYANKNSDEEKKRKEHEAMMAKYLDDL